MAVSPERSAGADVGSGEDVISLTTSRQAIFISLTTSRQALFVSLTTSRKALFVSLTTSRKALVSNLKVCQNIKHLLNNSRIYVKIYFAINTFKLFRFFVVGSSMVHGYHLVLPMYGFWLPNDPRGSWSEYVKCWELARFGSAQKGISRKSIEDLTEIERQKRDAAKSKLKFPAVSITGKQAAAVGRGFATKVTISGYTVWACAILPEHTHLVVARHSYKVETVANLLKGAATRELKEKKIHPLQDYKNSAGNTPPMWANRQWKVFLDDERAIEEAINYVEANPEKEDKPFQSWPFVSPFEGLPRGGCTSYH